MVLERLEPARDSVVFHTASGPLTVKRAGTGYVMDFPALPSKPITPPPGLAEALGARPVEVLGSASNCIAVLESAAALRALAPDIFAIAALDYPGLIVTAPGDGDHDFVSRYFAPRKGIPEDPVTGSAHCMLAPYWAGRLGKTAFRAFQASKRGGEVGCRLVGDRVELQGDCVFYLQGEAEI